MSKVREFLCGMTFANTQHAVGSPDDYGLPSWTALYELITGDEDMGALPDELRDDLCSADDRVNLAEDLRLAYVHAENVVIDLVNGECDHQLFTEIKQEMCNG